MDIHAAVFAMLHRVYIGSNKHAAVAWIYSSLSKAIWCEMSQLQTEVGKLATCFMWLKIDVLYYMSEWRKWFGNLIQSNLGGLLV